MIRKLIAAGVAAGLGALVLPALPAFASANSTASITSAKDVFPGARTYTLNITNSEAAGNIVAPGKAINAIRITLPTAAAQVTLATADPTCPGWTVKRGSGFGSQFIDLRSGTLAGGATLTCTIPTQVLQPDSTDLSGNFVVGVSSDGYVSAKNAAPAGAGALTTNVRILEVIGSTVRPTAPSESPTRGVTDRSGTSGQTVTYAFGVRNYAKNAVSVTPAMTSNNAAASPLPATATPVQPGETPTDLTVPVKLNAVTSGTQTNVTLTALATAPSAVAQGKNDTFTVQGPVTLTGANLQPLRLRSGENSKRDFTLDLTKTGVQTASLTGATLKFGSNNCTPDLPISFAGGTQTRNVTFKCADIVGGDGPLSVSLQTVGTDDNTAAVATTLLNLGTVVIDNIRPVVSITADLLSDSPDGDRRNAATNNHDIEITGTITGQDTGAAGSNDLDQGTLKVKIVPNAGTERSVTVTPTRQSDGSLTFRGLFNTGVWAPGTTRFQATASILDQATNEGFGTTEFLPVDLVLPVLNDPGTVLNPSTILVKFQDTNSVRGGCDPRAYSVGGLPGRVAKVQDADQDPNSPANCDPRKLGDGTRYLYMAENYRIQQTETPDVTYDPTGLASRTGGSRPAKDGSGQDVLRTVIDTVNEIVPIAPTLVNVQRKDQDSGANETAYFDADETAYYTNRNGATDNTITVAGIRNGYKLVVRDANGTDLNTAGPFAVTPDAFGREQTSNGSITVPIGAADGKYDRFLVLISGRGLESPALKITVALDTVRPALGVAAWNGVDTVTQKFSDKVVAGSNTADAWYATYFVAGNGGQQRALATSDSVSVVDTTTRAIKFDIPTPNTYEATYYGFGGNGSRYEDRGGNFLLDTLQP